MRLCSFIARTIAAAGLLAAMALTGCSMIDEDISKCNNRIRLTYELLLDPEIIQELEDELDLHADEDIRAMLKDYVDGVFTNYARDVDLFFYDTEDSMSLLRSMSETMNSASNTYAISMPIRSYMHTAVANVKVSENVHFVAQDRFPTAQLEHEKAGNYYTPQKSGLFSAHRQLDIGQKANQRFRIKLNMVNSATALILDTGKATEVTDIRVEVEGMATAFNLADSTFVYTDGAVFSTEEFSIGYKHCYAAVHFPSRLSETDLEESGTKADPEYDPHKPWHWIVYATLEDGTVTRSVLDMAPSVLAGQLKIRNAFVMDHGEVGSNEIGLSINVQLNWQEGPDIPIIL
jgi:hypothetical protein